MLKQLKYFTLGALGLWLLASCGSDVPYLGPEPERPAIPQYPTLSFLDTLGFITTDAFVQPSEEFFLKLKGIKGDSLLQTLEITSNSIPLDPSRIKLNGSTVTSSTITISGSERDDFIWELAIVAQAEPSKAIYQLTLEDETGRTDILDILINTKINNFTPPIITLTGQSDTVVLAENAVVYDFEVEAIGAPLKEITVYQGSETVETSRLKFDGIEFQSNPLVFTGADKEGFTKSIEIISSSVPGNQGYTIAILDSLDKEFFHEVSLNAIRRVDSTTGMILSSGMALDLDNGEQGDPSESTEIMDDGNDNTIGGSGEWRQTISGLNATSLKTINPDSLGVSFEEIIDENALNKAWDIAENFKIIRMDSIYNSIDSIYEAIIIKEKIEVGDLLIAQNDNALYLMKVTEISEEEFTLNLKY